MKIPTHASLEIRQATPKELELEILRLRDELIGAAAEMGELRAQLNARSLDEHSKELVQAVANTKELKRRLKAAEQQLDEIKGSASWKLGNLIIRPFSFLKRLISR